MIAWLALAVSLCALALSGYSAYRGVKVSARVDDLSVEDDHEHVRGDEEPWRRQTM